jgi:dolichol-phosphate mannosyltransferase
MSLQLESALRARPPVELSVVVPVYACRGSITELVDRARAVLVGLGQPFEIILVDDGSPDAGWDVVAALAHADPRVHAIRLSRNFGQHAAITAGLAASWARWAVVMDCDLQEPPEEIPRLYAKAKEGYDVVRTVRRERRHSRVRRWASRLYRYLLLAQNRTAEYSTLSIVSRKVVETILRLEDRDREYQLILEWIGFRQTTIEFEHAERWDGRSSYSLRRLMKVAFDGMYFRTTAPLRLVVALGVLVACGGVGLAVYEVLAYFQVGAPAGFTTLAVLLLLLSGFIIISLGVVGLYVGRIFEQVKRRPIFLVDEQIGGGQETAVDGEVETEAGWRER